LKKQKNRHDLAKDPSFKSSLQKLLIDGMRIKQVCEVLNISASVFDRLRNEYPEIKQIVDNARTIEVEEKRCSKCGLVKSLSNFQKDKARRGGYRAECKECWKQYHQNFYKENKQIIDAKNKDWYEENKVDRSRKIESYRTANKKRFAELKKQRMITDPLFCLRIKLRDRITKAFDAANWDKQLRTSEILGCDYNTAKAFIESRFKDGMTWANHGEWHIDHKKPLAVAKTQDELIALCHYTNLQPLWAVENLSKGAKLLQEEAA
jgi:hypothetical protein